MVFAVHQADECISSTIASTGAWEHFQTAMEAFLLSEGGTRKGTFVDVGANIGWHSMAMALWLGGAGQVYAFEPHPHNFALLQANAQINGFSNVELVKMACSNFAGSAKLYMGNDANMGTHSLYQEAGRDRPINVQVLTLDDYFKDVVLSDGPVVVKIDTEGSEPSVIQGGMRFIEAYKKRFSLFMELNFSQHSHNIDDVMGMLKVFREIGIEPFAISTSRSTLHLISYQYLFDSIEESMQDHGKFYADFLFCGYEGAKALRSYTHPLVNEISFRNI
ncbi:FkbM family methyltransferase [Azospirillum sp.]|uniref:FkbM family methyltransferase n=1 Tax=Azospirillum sp. TaxID=34012 RepID=UPI00262417D0|nr:FkbM family methyltransferase [Azospirillum sp.]